MRYLFGIIAMILLLGTAPARAATMYVSDELVVGVRSATGDLYQIVGYVQTGNAVEVLGEEGEFGHVRTGSGIEGYVPLKYLETATPKATVIKSLRAERDRLKEEGSKLSGERETLWTELKSARRSHSDRADELQERIEQLGGEAERLAAELEQVTHQYDTLREQARDVVALAEERDLLSAENRRLLEAEASAREERDLLKGRERVRWFLAGGGVLLLGWIVGRLSRRRRPY
jgi:SH3 domain protein